MALSIFDNKSAPPSDTSLNEALGRAAILWHDLKDRLARKFPPLDEQWGFVSKKSGWSLRVRQGEKTIVYLTPSRGYFFASFALGEKTVAAARESNLPAAVLATIDEAPRYVEGRGVRFEVRRQQDVVSIEKVAMLKIASWKR